MIMIIILLSIVAVSLFITIKGLMSRNKSKTVLKLLPIIILGLALRFLLSTTASLNFDMQMFTLWGTELFTQGKYNIYLYNWSYVYSPAIFFITGILAALSRLTMSIPYHVIHRVYISIIDVLTLLVLFAIAKNQKISPIRTAVFFFLNPVTILLSGYHGQFDNNAIFFLLLAVWIGFYRTPPLVKWKKSIVWFLLTIGFILKHIIPFQVFLVELSLFKKQILLKGSLLFAFTMITFLATFIPFYNNSESRFVINHYVLGYSGQSTISGVTGVIRFFCATCGIFGVSLFTIYRYIFLPAGMIFVLWLMHRKNLLHSLLLSFLFFLAFSFTHSPQYLVLPLALGALFPSRLFFIYSIAASVFLLVFQVEEGISVYLKVFLLNVVWIVAFFWFFSELIKVYKPMENAYRKTVNYLKGFFILMRKRSHDTI